MDVSRDACFVSAIFSHHERDFIFKIVYKMPGRIYFSLRNSGRQRVSSRYFVCFIASCRFAVIIK